MKSKHQTPVPATPSQPASKNKSEASSSEKTQAEDAVGVQSTPDLPEKSGGEKESSCSPTVSGEDRKDSKEDGIAVSTDAKSGSDSKDLKVSPPQFYALTPGILPPDFDDGDNQPSVLVDADYHVLYKEYNLRKSRTFVTTVKQPEKKRKKEADTPTSVGGAETTKSLPEKRERSEEDSGQNGAAKRLKTDLAAIEKEAENETEKKPEKSESPANKTSPHKRGRKPSLSQSSKSHGKKQACRGGGGANENDKEMLCCLCYKKDGANRLGFLFGPYKPNTDAKDKLKSPSTTTDKSGVLKEGESNTVPSPSSSSPSSLWVHEDCAVWAPGVCLVRGKLLGLHEAVEDGKILVGTCIYDLSKIFAL